VNRVRTASLLVLIAVGVAAVGTWGSFSSRGQLYHGGEDFALYVDGLGGLPDTSNSMFFGSGRCAGCHGEDPNDLASLAGQVFPAEPMPNGWDVNLTDHWRSSIMANSAKDPLWKAKIRHEVLINPEHQELLEDKCTSCHAPIGNFEAHKLATDAGGDTLYTVANLMIDTLALDGVSCAICHQQAPEGIGTVFSGELYFSEDTAYGPFGGNKGEYPVQWEPMFNFVGVMPIYGEHISTSEACAGCHTLLTSSVDLEGNFTGEQFVEQATFHEWLNSSFSEGPDAVQCQGCHMPQIQDSVVLAAGYAWLQPRAPFSLHTFVGANTHMLQILGENVELLGLSATAEEFDTTLAYTRDLLTQSSVELTLESLDGAAIDVVLRNKAGHKFPSGYPSRRSWIELVVVQENSADGSADTLFHSGAWSPDNYEIIGQEEVVLSAHHDLIDNEAMAQIYEMVMGDITGTQTTVLEQAFAPLKDNRLVPAGFSSAHPAYDTTAVVGEALLDDDFNFDSEEGEGTGMDRVTYDFSEALNAVEPGELQLTVHAKLWYQSIPPKWVAPMFELGASQGDSTIAAFEALYTEHPPIPELVTEVQESFIHVGISQESQFTAAEVKVFPNPTSNGGMHVESDTRLLGFTLHDAMGRKMDAGALNQFKLRLGLPSSGTYILRLETEKGEVVRRLIRE